MSKNIFGKHNSSLIVLTLMILGIKSIGRYELSKYLNQSIAKTRSLLNLLVNQNIATTSGKSSGKKGTSLTESGNKLYRDLSKHFQLYINPDLGVLINDLIPEDRSYSILFFNSDITKVTGLYERDLAVRNGAEGSVTLIKINNSWQFPDGFDISNSLSETFEVSKLFNSCIIVFSREISDSCVGAIAVAEYHLYEEIINILSDYF
ncbi:MAG: hypothetical protein HeimC2_06480 [Candidatus Heimdallarchaeota archaeon LC_2]|nr:MAG: hypothetical protein HeimC2_06480 [Candidatus Heimdallarchaeota archaeon LC_2]